MSWELFSGGDFALNLNFWLNFSKNDLAIPQNRRNIFGEFYHQMVQDQ